MPEQKKRKPVTHKHPCIAAAIHVLQEAGGGPLPAITIFQRAFDRGLLAATAYNTLRGRLSQHQAVAGDPLLRDCPRCGRGRGEPCRTPRGDDTRPHAGRKPYPIVVLKTPEGYMLAPEGVPDDTPERAVAPSRPPLPAPLLEDPLAVVPTPRPPRPRSAEARARDIVVTPQWLYDKGASADVLKWVRLARWRARWRDEGNPTARDLLTGWLPPQVAAWLIETLPLDPDLRERLSRAVGQDQRRRIIEGIEEKPSSSAPPSADTAVEEDTTSDQKEPNGTTTGAER